MKTLFGKRLFMTERRLTGEPVELVVDASQSGVRLDQYLARQFPTYSRVHLRRVINAAGVRIFEGDVERGGKPAYVLRGNETIRIHLPPLPREMPRSEDIPLSIIYEDEQLVVVNKPPGMVVHPARGHWSGTLTSALQFHFDHLSQVGGPQRPGIVHRLDRDTSGVILVAKDDVSHHQLAAQFQERSLEKEYFAIVVGKVSLDRDRIVGPIGIHPHVREKMAIRADHETSKDAETFYEVIERFNGYTAVRVLPKTGRTHQIRVHFDWIGHPVLCDRLYGGRAQITRGELERSDRTDGFVLERQALHAHRLVIDHPVTGQRLEFKAPLPQDMEDTLALLRAYRSL